MSGKKIIDGLQEALDQMYGVGWRFPKWEQVDENQWLFRQAEKVVGEAYELNDGKFKWHCKTSDWRNVDALSIEQAKAECEASFWQEEWQKLRVHLPPSGKL